MPDRAFFLMKQDGYTVVEALAALAIIGLAIAGLTASMALIGHGQTQARNQIEQAVLERAATESLERFVARGAPYRSDQTNHLVGGRSALEFDCDAGRCSARLERGGLVLRASNGGQRALRLPPGEDPHFVYIGSVAQSEKWPSSPLLPPGPSWQRLEAVLIQGGAEGGLKLLVVARVWRQQRPDCEYDVVSQDCRNEGS